MIRIAVVLLYILSGALALSAQKKPPYPTFDYDVARAHEVKPHRRTIPLNGVRDGFNQIHLTLIVSDEGDVIKAEANGDQDALKFWPQLQGEVTQWKFAPFEENGKPVTAEVIEYIDLVPPERFPKHHVAPPVLKANSDIAITLQRTGCFGSCPSYNVTVSTKGVLFVGRSFVVATGKHTDTIDPAAVRQLAQRFIKADFYSMNSEYRAGVTDNPTYVLTIDIDGRKHSVVDYVGSWVGMPEVITDLEDAVDHLARTDRWIKEPMAWWMP